MLFGKLFLEATEFKFLQQVDLLAYATLDIGAKITSVLYFKVVSIDHSHWSGISIDVLHALHIVDRYEIAGLVVVRVFGGHLAFLLVCDQFNGYPR